MKGKLPGSGLPTSNSRGVLKNIEKGLDLEFRDYGPFWGNAKY